MKFNRIFCAGVMLIGTLFSGAAYTNESDADVAHKQMLYGSGSFVFGRVAPFSNSKKYMLDTKTGRLWVLTKKNKVMSLEPVIYEQCSTNFKCNPDVR